MLIQAVNALLGVCDGARQQDSAGFNRFDGGFVRSLPLDNLTPKQALAVYNLLRKYKGQLSKMGIDYDKIAKPAIPDAPPPIDMAAIRAKVAAKPPEPKPAPPEQKRCISVENGNFVIEFPYNQTDIDRVKKLIPTARFKDENGRKFWWVAVGVGSAEAVRELSKTIPVSDGVNQVVAGIIAKAAINTELSRAESHTLDMGDFLKPPRPFQCAGIQYWLDNERTFIADSMGLGKTVIALGGVFYLGVDRALAITPASLKLNWGKEAASCIPAAGRMFFSFRRQSKKHYDEQGNYLCTEYPYAHARVMNPAYLILVVDSKAPDDLVEKANFIAINYDLLSAGWLDQKKKQVTLTPLAIKCATDIKALVCDESHYVKNEKAQRTCATKKISRDIKYRALLTGTPIDNRPLEIISQLDILDRLDEFGGSWKFKQRYCGAHQIRIPGRGMAWDFSGASNLSELNAKLRATCFIRRKKEDVLTELPPKTWVRLPFELTNRKEYTKAEKDLLKYVKEITYLAEKTKHTDENAVRDGVVLTPEEIEAKARLEADLAAAKAAKAQVLVGIGILRRLCAEGKMAAVKEWVADFMETGEKLVVFAHHVEIQHQLLQEFKQWGAVGVLGADSATVRAENVSRFQNDPGVRVIVVSLSAGAEGITLTASSTVLFVEHPWTPGKKAQAEDRCLAEGTPILTPDGWKPIESIQIGDYIIAESGTARKVIDAWSSGCRKQMTDLLIEGWGTVSSTSDHQFLTVNGWKHAQDLKPGDKLTLPGNSDTSEVSAIKFDDDVRLTTSNGMAAPAPDDIALTDGILFTLGYYVGDGFSSTKPGKGRFVSFAGNKTNKRACIERIQSVMSEYGTATIYESKTDQGIELRFYSTDWAFWFAKHFGQKCESRQLPAWILRLNERQSRKVLSGLIASDGYVRKNRYEYITSSHKLAGQVALLVMRSGLRPCITRQSTGCYVIAYSIGIPPSALVKAVTHRFPARTKGKHERVYDLTVETESSFVTGLVVAHNCHRIGQRDNVTIYDTEAPMSFDEDLLSLLQDKSEIVAALADGDQQASASQLQEILNRIAARQ